MGETDFLFGPQRFTFEGQLQFATLSGDANPLHVDPNLARRTRFGKPVVHGLHVVMRGLESLAHVLPGAFGLTHLKAVFSKPIRIEETAEIEVLLYDPNKAQINFRVAKTLRSRINIGFKVEGEFNRQGDLGPMLSENICHEFKFSECRSARGKIPIFFDSGKFQSMFPQCSQRLASNQVGSLLTTSRLVGMVCPGFHSLFSELDIQFSVNSKSHSEMFYKVIQSDERFELIKMKVEDASVSGTIKAFFRPSPAYQANFVQVRNKVKLGYFSGERALIIGGSRGVGEITAKIISAGGGDVCLTFNAGEEEAARLVNEIRLGNGRASYFQLNILDPDVGLAELFSRDWRPTQIYYFATPAIFIGDEINFSASIFEEFSKFYVTGFFHVSQYIRQITLGPIEIFYPSTVAINEETRSLTEYVCAKSAGEALCEKLDHIWKETKVRVVRLPMMRTDQMPFFLPKRVEDPFEVMLRVLKCSRN